MRHSDSFYRYYTRNERLAWLALAFGALVLLLSLILVIVPAVGSIPGIDWALFFIYIFLGWEVVNGMCIAISGRVSEADESDGDAGD